MEKNKIGYNIFKWLIGIIFLIYYRPKFTNKKIIPKKGPIIICGNHLHIYDQSLPILSTNRMLHYMAKKEYFDSKFAWFFKASGCISVDREHHGGTSKELAKEVLDDGYALGIYPEGTRNSLAAKEEKFNLVYEYIKNDISKKKFKKIVKKNMVRVSQIDLLFELKESGKISIDEFKTYIYDANTYLKRLLKEGIIESVEYEDSLLLPIKFGTVSLAEKTNATIVPYGIKGKYKLFNNNLEIIFGKPFKIKNMTLEEANEKLRKEIIDLIK